MFRAMLGRPTCIRTYHPNLILLTNYIKLSTDIAVLRPFLAPSQRTAVTAIDLPLPFCCLACSVPRNILSVFCHNSANTLIDVVSGCLFVVVNYAISLSINYVTEDITYIRSN